ncbi:MAG: hypothetical protein AB7S41_11400 [Parvibaculaceae bacterium]
MEMVIGLFATLGTTAGGTAAAAGAAGAAAAGTAAAGSTALTILQGVGTAFSALSLIGAGRSERARYEGEAAEARLKGREEYIAGVEESAKLKRELAYTLSEQKVQFAAAGVDLGSVSVSTARSQAIADAERELGYAQNDALRANLARQRQARNLKALGRSAETQGWLGAGQKIANFAAEAYERG